MDTVRAFSQDYPCARRRLGDGEIVIPTYRHQGRKGWWGKGTPVGWAGDWWYFYHPFHARVASFAIPAIQRALGHPVALDASSDEEPYFWVAEVDARRLMAHGPRWCRVRRKKAKNLVAR